MIKLGDPAPQGQAQEQGMVLGEQSRVTAPGGAKGVTPEQHMADPGETLIDHRHQRVCKNLDQPRIIHKHNLENAVNTLELSLLSRGFANRINAEDDVCVIAIVGAGMKGSQGVAARVFKAVADKRINVRMIAQGSSELNISIVVKEKSCEKAVMAIHKEFDMGKS